jgi:hypothetical protein
VRTASTSFGLSESSASTSASAAAAASVAAFASSAARACAASAPASLRLCRARGDGRELQLLDRPVDLDELAHLVLHQALGFLGERIDAPLDELRQRVLEPGGQATDGFFFHGISLFLERCQPALEKKARVSGPSQRRSRACFLLKT